MREWLASKVFFPLHERLSSHTFWSGYLEMKELQWTTREELLHRSFQKLKALMTHSYEHVPYYQTLFREAGIEPRDIKGLSDLSRVPVTYKADLRHNFPDRVTARNLGAHRRRRGQTSGSTGLPFQFFTDLGSLDILRSAYLFFDSWAGLGPWVRTIVIANPPHFYSHEPSNQGRFTIAMRRMLIGNKRLLLGGLDLSLEEYVNHLRRFRGWGSHYILSSPSFGDRLASQIVEKGVELPQYPCAFISTGETLTKLDEHLISNAFRCTVINSYGMLEIPYIAQTCPDNPDVLHVNSERAVVRVVRDDGTDAPQGEVGRIVITDLVNYVMPFINYDSGDWGALGNTCSCGRGFPTLERLEGRASEAILTPGGKAVAAFTLGRLLVDVWETLPCIWEYQAIQPAADRVVLKVVPAENYTEEFEERLKNDLEEFLGDGMMVNVEAVARIDTEPSGKRLIIKSELSQHDRAKLESIQS